MDLQLIRANTKFTNQSMNLIILMFQYINYSVNNTKNIL